MPEWADTFGSELFWSGVFASIVAAGILGVVGFVARNSIQSYIEQRERGKNEDKILSDAIDEAGPYAAFSFGVIQARALRQFLLAVFIGYVGDILSLLYPFNLIIYIICLYFILQGLRWLYRIERKGLEILTK